MTANHGCLTAAFEHLSTEKSGLSRKHNTPLQARKEFTNNKMSVA
jgi:hypothetical protein